MEKLRELKLVNGRLQVESKEGIIYEVDVAGNKRIIAVGAHWLKTRQTTWANDVVQLCRSEKTTTSIEIMGLQLPDNRTIACWYDTSQNQFTMSPKRLANEKLLHLGSITKEAGAWIYQPSSGRLYQQPTFTSEWATFVIDRNGRVVPSILQKTSLNEVLPNERINRATRLDDGRVVAVTQSGLTLLLEPGMLHWPLVLAVNQNWVLPGK